MPDSIRYVFHTEVTQIEERFKPVWKGGVGVAAAFDQVSLGWFAYLKGSYEMLHVGDTKPELKVGDKIKVTIEKEPST